MGKLLPVRHPNRDFFIVDVADATPKDDMVSMEHPVYSLSTKPDMRELDYNTGRGQRLRVVPSGRGLATIFDKDILLYCISKLVTLKNQGKDIAPYVDLSAHEVMVACNWNTENKSYKRFEDALIRLRGTTLQTDIETGGKITSDTFGLIESASVIRKDADGKETPFGRMTRVRIKLSDWTFNAVQSLEVLSINPQYFRLRRPLERRLYEIARKHVGKRTEPWTIGIAKLQSKVGTNAPLKKFRFNLKEIIRDGNIPDYSFELQGDNVVMRCLIATPVIDTVTSLPLRADTIDKAQAIAAKIGVSVFVLEQEWNTWNREKGTTPDKPDGAFIAFCKQKLASSPARRVVKAREKLATFEQLGLSLKDREAVD